MKLRFSPYTLELKHTFTIATSSRTTTPAMMVEVEQDGITGYGEASMPPYLGESQESAAAFLSKVDLSVYKDPMILGDLLAGIDAIAPGNPAAKAAVDIALHDWVGKKFGQPWFRIWGLDPAKTPRDLLHHRDRHQGGGPPEGQGGRHLQGAQGQAGSRQRQGDDRDDPRSDRQADHDRCEPGVEGQVRSAQDDRMAGHEGGAVRRAADAQDHARRTRLAEGTEPAPDHRRRGRAAPPGRPARHGAPITG